MITEILSEANDEVGLKINVSILSAECETELYVVEGYLVNNLRTLPSSRMEITFKNGFHNKIKSR